MAPIVPAVFEVSVAGYLIVEMPRVTTGSYNEPRITTSLTSGWKGTGDVTDSTASALTVETSTVKRLSGRMSLRMKDVASVGMEDFEAALRMNLQQVVSNALDSALLNGTGASDQPTGLLARLTDPTAAGWGEGRAAAPAADWKPQRLGPAPTEAQARIARDSFERVLAACGCPPSLFIDSDGTSQREGLRRWHLSTVVPLPRILEDELSRKLEAEIRLQFDSYPLDMVSRAQVVSKLVQAGVALDTATLAVGLD